MIWAIAILAGGFVFANLISRRRRPVVVRTVVESGVDGTCQWEIVSFSSGLFGYRIESGGLLSEEKYKTLEKAQNAFDVEFSRWDREGFCK